MSRTLRFNGTSFVEDADPLAGGQDPDLADSFRARFNTVRAFQLHRHRFFEDLALLDPSSDIDPDAVCAAISRELVTIPESFPRIDVVNGELWLRIRPLPLLTTSLNVFTAKRTLEKQHVKGPNISEYAAMNAQHGGETILVDDLEFVVEGATTSILWWHTGDRDAAVHTVASSNRVPSTTEQTLVRIAEHQGTTVRQASVQPSELARAEVWAVNALHGIRTVTSIDGQPTREPDTERLRVFREAFDDLWERIAP